MTLSDYFQSHNNYFWQWEEDKDVLAIPKENTIAYREFIVEVLEKLSHQGVPPFGALLLTIIATNSNGPSSIDVVYTILSKPLANDGELVNAIEFLKLLTEVPEEFKQGKKRLLLLQAIFENCHNSASAKKSKDILHYFTSKNFYKGQPSVNPDYSLSCFRRDLKTIGLLKNKFSNVSQILEKVTALPDFKEEIPELENPSENAESKDLTEQLIDNPKTFHVGSLIKQIWSGLNIPLHSTLPSQQPLGGVADLTNKGDFDKLLISEFANDDIVFLSRLANNEALYIHREIPPANNNLERIILMDVSLKNWGTPKAVSFATMLAIATHPKTDIVCSAFAIGNSFHPVSTESVETIIDGLQHLEGSLNAANGLTAFFNEHPASKNQEIFLITEPSTLKQPAMLKVMNDYQPFISYLIFTDSFGAVDIYKKQQRSKKHIQHLQLPLKKLWEKGSKKQHLNERANENSSHYPLLFRITPNVKSIMTTLDRQTFAVTGDKTLIRFYDNEAKPHTKGWEVLLEKIPVSTGQFEMGLTLKGDYILLMYNMQTRELTLINLMTDEKKSFNFQNWKSTSMNSFVFQNQKFYHLNNGGVWSFDFEGMEQIYQAGKDVPGKNIFENRAVELKKVMSTFKSDYAVFRNIKTIFINEKDHLVFNIHELLVNNGTYLKLDKIGRPDLQTKKLEAAKVRGSEFLLSDGSIKETDKTGKEPKFMFPDGSSVEINKAGVFILKSSSDKIPVIYLPPMLNSSLAAATETIFAGNEFYYPEPQFDILLVKAGERKLHVVKSIRSMIDMKLDDALSLVETPQCRLINHVSKTTAENIKKTLEADGATVEMHLSKPSALEIEMISVPFFYERYIDPFIKHILKHGPENKTLS